MTRTSLSRLGVTLALAGVALAACGGTGTTTTSSAPSTGASTAPSAAVESPMASASASMDAGASSSAGASMAPSGSPAARTVQVQAFEGTFMNAPVDPAPGTVLTFRNVGKEAHEMVVIRRNDDATDTQTFEDLSKVNPADLVKFVTVVGVLAADPGQEATGQIVLTDLGDYAIVDLLATGTATAPASPDPLAIPTGIPNVVNGMWATFSVVEPTS